MRTPTGVKRPAGNERKIELVRESSASRCFDALVELGELIRCGRSSRRKPEIEI